MEFCRPTQRESDENQLSHVFPDIETKAYRSKPVSYTHLGDEVVGIDMDIAKAIADEMGKELEIKNMDFDGALLAVQQGKADFVAAGVSAVSYTHLDVYKRQIQR